MKIQEDQARTQKSKEAEWDKALLKEKEAGAALRDTITEIKAKIDGLSQELRATTSEKKKLENDLLVGKKQREQEVMLRLRFEEKLNNLHSLNRSFQ